MMIFHRTIKLILLIHQFYCPTSKVSRSKPSTLTRCSVEEERKNFDKLNVMRESYFWTITRWFWVVVLSLAIWPVTSVCLMLVTGMGWRTALYIGLVAYCWIYPRYLLKHFIINPDTNFGVVLQNKLLFASTEDEAELNVNPEAIPSGQRAVYTGLNVKYPWEFPVCDPIPMVTEVPTVNTFVATDKDGKRWNITTTVPLTPLGGQYLTRYLRAGDGAAKAYFGSVAENCVRTALSDLEGKAFAKNVRNSAKEIFDAAFGGTNTTTDEKRYGRFTNEPFISAMTPFGEDQIYDQVEDRIKKVKEGFTALAGADAVMDPRDAASAVAAASGENVHYINVTGLGAGSSLWLGDGVTNKGEGKDRKGGKKP
jgi:hypothetical protein